MIDPIAQAKQEEEAGRMPFIAVQEFRIDYVPQADGSQKPVEWVAWVKKGSQNPAVTEEKISRLSKDPSNLVWQVIEPYYKRWKQNEDAPIVGTPLAAWPGGTPALVKTLGQVNIRSVEDLAGMEDSAIMKMAIPNLRDKQKQARAFLEAQKSTASVANENAKLKETVENQAKELLELRALIEQLGTKQAEAGEAKRGPGRPRKIETQAA